MADGACQSVGDDLLIFMHMGMLVGVRVFMLVFMFMGDAQRVQALVFVVVHGKYLDLYILYYYTTFFCA